MIWTKEQIGERLLLCRRENGLTQTDLAVLLGISRNYLALIERGEADNISLSIYASICDWIGVPVHKPDSLDCIFTEMYTALVELAGIHGADSYTDEARQLLKRYRNVTGHMLRP